MIDGGHRIAPRNGNPDVFSIGFESCQGHTVDQDACESEIIGLIDELAENGQTYSTVGLVVRRLRFDVKNALRIETHHAGKNFNDGFGHRSEGLTATTVLGIRTRQVRTPATKTA